LRRTTSNLICEAFPKAIPALIFIGIWDYTIPYHVGDLDDHGLTYIP
jgi:hypothetical protein